MRDKIQNTLAVVGRVVGENGHGEKAELIVRNHGVVDDIRQLLEAAVAVQRERSGLREGTGPAPSVPLAIEAVEEAAGKPPVGFRTPSGSYSPATVELLLEHGSSTTAA